MTSGIDRNEMQTPSTDATDNAQPSVSVIIAWVNEFGLLDLVLKALSDQVSPPNEVIVATRHQGTIIEQLRLKYPSVSLIECLHNDTIPTLRAAAIKNSKGEIVAVMEDHCLPCKNWIANILQSMTRDVVAVGGPVEQGAFQRWRDWAAFLTEYAFAIGPCEAGPVGGLAGNNVAYRRELCDDLVQTLEAQRWESFYHIEVIENGKVFWLDPNMVVAHNRPFDIFYFLAQRYYFCRSYAGMRWSSPSMMHRLIYGLGSVVLPPMLWLRSLRDLMKKKRYVARYVCLTPLIILYFIAGALGEMAGYFFGSQRSLERVE